MWLTVALSPVQHRSGYRQSCRGRHSASYRRHPTPASVETVSALADANASLAAGTPSLAIAEPSLLLLPPGPYRKAEVCAWSLKRQSCYGDRGGRSVERPIPVTNGARVRESSPRNPQRVHESWGTSSRNLERPSCGSWSSLDYDGRVVRRSLRWMHPGCRADANSATLQQGFEENQSFPRTQDSLY